MPIVGKYFPSQISGERVFLLIRRHWIIFAIMLILSLVLFVPVIVLIFYWLSNSEQFVGFLGNFVIVFAGMYTLSILALLLYGFVNYYLDVYIVTNQRIVDIKQNGFFRRTIAELHLHQIQDVEARVEGFLQTLIHFGTIYIQTAGERENFVFEDVPHPYTLAKEIVELHEAQIEAEYEPQIDDEPKSDEIRLEDYYPPQLEEKSTTSEQKSEEVKLEESDGGIKSLEEKYEATDRQSLDLATKADDQKLAQENEQPLSEVGFGSKQTEMKNQNHGELSEGQEVKIDEND